MLNRIIPKNKIVQLYPEEKETKRLMQLKKTEVITQSELSFLKSFPDIHIFFSLVIYRDHI